MLLLVFRLGDDRFALDARNILEVLPLVAIGRTPGAPACISGTFNYRGRFVPVVDLSQRLLGRPAEPRLSTRVVLASLPGEGDPILCGLIVENATETRRCLPADLMPPALASREHPWLGPITVDSLGVIQLVELDKLLPEDVRRSLLALPAEVA